MTPAARAFVMTALGALVGASVLHLLMLAGQPVFWPAMVHLTLFGWISGLILAVNYHTVPVFAGRAFPYPRLIGLHWAGFTIGVALTTASQLMGRPTGVTLGLLLQLAAALLFATNIMLLFLRGPRGAQRPPAPHPDQPRIDRLASYATRSAGLCLPLALLLLLAQRWGWLAGGWHLAAEHLVTLGWIILMIAGVAYHVLPRFSGQPLRGIALVRAQLLCHGSALALIVLALGNGWPRVFAAGGLLMALGLGLFAWTIWPTLVAINPRRVSIALSVKRPSS